MDFDRLQTFARIVEAGSLSKAARTLGLSLPAVSRKLVALEEELDTKLVLRTTRAMQLTEAGRRFYEHTLRVLRAVDEARAAIDGTALTGPLAVTAPISFGLLCLLPILPGLAKAHPSLTLELHLEDRFADLVGEGVDVALRAGVDPPESTALIARRLGTWKRLVVASPKYLRANGRPRHPAQLAKHRALVQLGSTWRFFDGGEELAVEVHGPLATNAPLALVEAAKSGLGVALVPEWCAERAIGAGELEVLLPSFTTRPASLYALYRAEYRGSERIRAFVDYLAKAFARGFTSV